MAGLGPGHPRFSVRMATVVDARDKPGDDDARASKGASEHSSEPAKTTPFNTETRLRIRLFAAPEIGCRKP
jgi:hypothetical protein